MYQKQSFDFITKQVAKKMNKELLCVVLLMVLVTAAESSNPPFVERRRVGRHFKVLEKLFTVNVCFALVSIIVIACLRCFVAIKLFTTVQ